MCPADQSAYALEFASLWDSLHAKRGYGWDANPWVVVIAFKPHRCNIDDMEQTG